MEMIGNSGLSIIYNLGLTFLFYDTKAQKHQPVCLSQSGRKAQTYLTDFVQFWRLGDLVSRLVMIFTGQQ